MLLKESGNEEAGIDSDEYEVEDVIDKQIVGDKIYYKVFWKGYDISESTWEEKNNLENCMDLVNQFETKRATKHPINEDTALLQSKRSVNQKTQLKPGASNKLNSEQSALRLNANKTLSDVDRTKNTSDKEELLVYSAALHHYNSSIINSIFDSATPNRICKVTNSLPEDSMIKLDQEIFCLIEFKAETTGYIRDKCLISTKIFKMYYPVMLVDYYEKYIKLNK